ncbi:MAG: HDOD domain-containing protein [Gallionella sp.]
MNSPHTTINLKEAANHLDSLPSMPVIAQKLLALNLDSVEGERMLLKLIEQDPQISAKIIGLSNTPLFGASKRVTSVQDAAILLGLTRVKAVTMSIAVMTSLIKKPAGKLDLQKLWLHSISISLALRVLSQAMPRNTRPLDDEIFLAGLLHDIGFMVLNHLDQERSDELHARLAANKDLDPEQIENELLEMNHGDLGAELARYWELPESIIAVIRFHHQPNDERAITGQPLVSMINLAEKILAEYGTQRTTPKIIDADEWSALGINPTHADEISAKVLEQAEIAQASAGTLG